MKHILKLIYVVVVAMIFVACDKAKDISIYSNGAAVTLTSSASTLTPARADSNNTILTLNWTSPNYSTDTSRYKYIVQIDSTGKNFSRMVTRETGSKRTYAFTGRDLNSILLGFGYALGKPVTLDMRVLSSYANNNEQYLSNIVKVTVTPYGDPSQLVTQNTSVTGTLATATQPSNTFTWSPSFVGYTGTVTYTLQYDSAGKNFVAPIDFPIGNSVLSKTLTQAEMNQTAISSGIPMGNSGKVEYRIKAQTAQGAVAYSNTVNVTIQSYVSILRVYVPGGYQTAQGLGTDWTPANAPQMIRDTRTSVFNQLYYAYMYFNAGDEFKITVGAAWDVNYGPSAIGQGVGTGDLAAPGNNWHISTSGVYRLSVDIKNMKWDLRTGRMGFVGGAVQPVDWNPPLVFPTSQMGFSQNNLFVGVYDFSAGGWKMIDNNSWNNGSNTVDETRSYGSAGGPGSILEVNTSTNMPDMTAGSKRIVWDGRNPDNVKWDMSPATIMKVVGNGIQGVPDWTPSASPTMTYLGNGKWQITNITLVGNKEIKFLAGADWGAFDYEDASGGNQTLGTPMKMSFDIGGPNFKTPAVTGTYTITLDENKQTVTIQ